MQNRNLSMLVDFYELTMANGYFENGIGEQIAYFDMFFRKVPDNGGYAVMAGVEQLIEQLSALSFSDEDIKYFRDKGIFSEGFLDYLANFKFACDVWAIPEGTPIFPQEPIITVRGPAIQAQFIETIVLLTINHQSLIATKASRIVKAADGRGVMEFGSRRAQGYDGAIYGARAAYIGGCVGTACTISDKELGVPAMGTMAHSWIQMFPDELSAFRAYAKLYPNSCTFLVDTYNVLKSGVPNAVIVLKELALKGFHGGSIRIDSGDITYLSKKARIVLDAEGLFDCKIVASNSLDEYIIRDILLQGAKVDSFGVGERLVTSRSEPVFGGVYKLSAVEKDGEIHPKIKLSESDTKITNPGFKEIWRLYEEEGGKAIADVVTVNGEEIDSAFPYEIFDPQHIYKRKKLTDFIAKKLQIQIFKGGKCAYFSPKLDEIQKFCTAQLETIWDEVRRFENPHEYYVDLSQKLYDMKQALLQKYL